MHFRRTIVFALPLFLTSSLALAETPPSSTGSAVESSTDATKQSVDATKKKSTKKAKPKVENKDKDLDTAVGETKTTSAEPQPAKPDVVESRAEEVREVEGKRWSAAPLLGYGTADLKFGIGARAGYTFKTPVYVGGTFLYHFGNTSVVSPSGSNVVESERKFYYPAAEIGYDFGMGPILVRPYGGASILFVRTQITSNNVASDTVTDKQLMIYPGVTAQYILPKSPVFVGGDIRALLPLEGESASFSLFATAGLTM